MKKYSNFRLVGELLEGETFGELCFKVKFNIKKLLRNYLEIIKKLLLINYY